MAVKVATPNGKPHVLMMTMLMPYLRDSLESKFNLVPLWEHSHKDDFLTSVGDSVRAVVTSTTSVVDRKLLEKLPKVEIISSFSVGLDKVDLNYCKEKGIVVTNTPEVLTDDCADLALALLLATMRQICSADRYVRKGCWPKQGDYPLSYKVNIISPRNLLLVWIEGILKSCSN
jgi:lactate dehydrogenase-like 2-hydroxyacid dehydrogenase